MSNGGGGWYTTHAGQVWGPSDESEVVRAIASGHLPREAFFGGTPTGPWLPLASHPAFGAALGGTGVNASSGSPADSPGRVVLAAIMGIATVGGLLWICRALDATKPEPAGVAAKIPAASSEPAQPAACYVYHPSLTNPTGAARMRIFALRTQHAALLFQAAAKRGDDAEMRRLAETGFVLEPGTGIAIAGRTGGTTYGTVEGRVMSGNSRGERVFTDTYTCHATPPSAIDP